MPQAPVTKVDPYLETLQEFLLAAEVRLDRDGLVKFDQVFMDTVEAFTWRATAPADGWENPKLRDFILGQARRIAERVRADAAAAGASAGRTTISGDAFLAAAVAVMRETSQTCEAAIRDGRIVGLPGTEEGDLCGTFLSRQAT